MQFMTVTASRTGQLLNVASLARDVAVFSVLDAIPNVKRGSGGVVCLYDSLTTLQGDDRSIPVAML
ncbi:MAG: hypothetical protein LBH86_05345 [Oscillospiraceae bacterium]|nr:hypothetical protein [Oscillospiraceae bacterium]